MDRRHEPRYQVKLDVKISGMDRHGKPFLVHTSTFDANSTGARLSGLGFIEPGESIDIRHNGRLSRCKVVWTGRENTSTAGHIGIQCFEPGKPLFEVQASTPSEIAIAEIEQAGSGFAPQPPTARSFMQDRPASRRKNARYHCSGGVELRRSEDTPPIFGNLSDISLEGCYVETVSTWPAGTDVLFVLRVRDQIIRGRAHIKTSHHAVGMGMHFQNLGAEDQHKLEFLMGTLAGLQEMRPEEKRTYVPADLPERVPPVPPPTRPAITASNTRSAPAPKGAMSLQTMRAIGELNQLEQNLVKERVDPRLIAQFHDAVEHMRQTAWTVQQWMDTNSSGGDPFEVLPQLEAERMQMLGKLAHNVTADIDSSSINQFTLGVSDLYESVEQLYRRLRKMLVDEVPEG